MYYKLGQACVTSWDSFVLLQIGEALLQIGAASLLQIRESVVTNWGSYYKLGQLLLKNRSVITNWGKTYHKLGQVLQIRAIITNWGIAVALKDSIYTSKTWMINRFRQQINPVVSISFDCRHGGVKERIYFVIFRKLGWQKCLLREKKRDMVCCKCLRKKLKILAS